MGRSTSGRFSVVRRRVASATLPVFLQLLSHSSLIIEVATLLREPRQQMLRRERPLAASSVAQVQGIAAEAEHDDRRGDEDVRSDPPDGAEHADDFKRLTHENDRLDDELRLSFEGPHGDVEVNHASPPAPQDGAPEGAEPDEGEKDAAKAAAGNGDGGLAAEDSGEALLGGQTASASSDPDDRATPDQSASDTAAHESKSSDIMFDEESRPISQDSLGLMPLPAGFGADSISPTADDHEANDNTLDSSERSALREVGSSTTSSSAVEQAPSTGGPSSAAAAAAAVPSASSAVELRKPIMIDNDPPSDGAPEPQQMRRAEQELRQDERKNVELDALENAGCTELNKLHVREARIRNGEEPLEYQVRQLEMALTRAERVPDQDSTMFHDFYREAIQQRDCLFWLVDEAKKPDKMAHLKQIGDAIAVDGEAHRGAISALERRYRRLFSGELKPRRKTAITPADVLRNKVENGDFTDNFDDYLAMHIVQENDSGDKANALLGQGESMTHNSEDDSMAEVVEKAGAWLGEQERVARRLHEDYAGLRDHFQAASSSLPQDIEKYQDPMAKRYPGGVVSGSRALQSLQEVIPSYTKHTKEKLMKILEGN
eukprot:CAMPEP_0178998426 /NCGR_PEP_ID=MMETSP0795-20121207/9505_1 /TAXON_ID=88552 /ORGANISM="Amoebophrya sp., Strain Ameob2" /LENGTH=602 /DNA_ID=CAMNT_0020691101 /DNA_START=124 /DNA_END=1932 /DNA_ORIENTATION=+